ncbi:hypothetical protein MJL81_32370, partial [Salmonella enterica subsp. enterica serovar Anatum]|nr:hypothetical protein [Salmonella enterica subsp. enterica serovar Anatum]
MACRWTLSRWNRRRTELYAALNRDFQSLMAGETSFLATLANTSALLFERLTEVNWA